MKFCLHRILATSDPPCLCSHSGLQAFQVTVHERIFHHFYRGPQEQGSEGTSAGVSPAYHPQGLPGVREGGVGLCLGSSGARVGLALLQVKRGLGQTGAYPGPHG